MDQETRIQIALKAIRAKTIPSIRKAANLYDIPRSTLQARLHGA